MRRPPVALTAGAGRCAAPLGGAGAGEGLLLRRPGPGRLALAGDAARFAQHRGEPDPGRFRGDQPWAFATRAGIFSTPVIGDDGTVYVGSADGNFYASASDGKPAWQLPNTGGIIDSAAALGKRRGKGSGAFPITIGSGDETSLPAARRHPQAQAQAGIVWRYRTDLTPATGSTSTGGRATPPTAPGGDLFVGNTGGGAYSLTPGGKQAGSTSAGQLGVDDAGLRYAQAQQLLGLGRPVRRSRSIRKATSAGRRRYAGYVTSRPRSAPTAPSTSARSTASCTRSTRTPGPSAGASPPPPTSTARPRCQRRRRATRPRSTSARPTAPSTRSTRRQPDVAL